MSAYCQSLSAQIIIGRASHRHAVKRLVRAALQRARGVNAAMKSLLLLNATYEKLHQHDKCSCSKHTQPDKAA